MTPLVSTLIPAYNAERWVAKAVESVLAQTWPNHEIIVVDDGSSDGTLAVARRFESARVRIVAQPNRGASAARNHALRLCGGDYIQFLDADDLLSPQKIEEQVRLLEDHPPGYVAVCATMYFYDGMPPAQGYLLDDGWPMVDTDDPLDWLIELLGPDGRSGTVHPGAWLVPRAVAERAGAWDESLSLDDDGEYFARVVLASRGIRRAAAGLSYYRKHRAEGNLSSKASEPFQWSAIHSIDSRARRILSRTDSARAKRALARAYMDRAVFAYPEYPAVSAAALRRARELTGTPHLPSLGGWRIEAVRRLFGWRAARRVSHAYRGLIASASRRLIR